MTRQKEQVVIDLCCGEGGASKGYSEAGFNVVGVDNDPERIARYPFSAYLGDWHSGLDYWAQRMPWDRIAFVHASPPCQEDSEATWMARARGVEVNYPRLIDPMRRALQSFRVTTGAHWVIENVPQAPLIEPTILCGSMFCLGGTWHGKHVGLKRHRGFESTFPITAPAECGCDFLPSVPVYGHGAPGYRDGDSIFKGKGFAQLTRDVMGIDWMSRRGLTEAIPPAYAEYVGYSYQIHSGGMTHVSNRSGAERHSDTFDHVK